MIRYIHIFLFSIFFETVCVGQTSTDGLIGIYESVDNKFERYSTLIIKHNNRFIYQAGVGACQVEVTGRWTIEDKKLKFVNDSEFLNNDIITYPDLSKANWKIKKFGVKPDSSIDSGCIVEEKIHRKR